jgi:hypothetical protein
LRLSTGVLSAAIGCLLEGVENDYRLISGYFGGIGFEGFQEVLILPFRKSGLLLPKKL